MIIIVSTRIRTADGLGDVVTQPGLGGLTDSGNSAGQADLLGLDSMPRRRRKLKRRTHVRRHDDNGQSTKY